MSEAGRPLQPWRLEGHDHDKGGCVATSSGDAKYHALTRRVSEALVLAVAMCILGW